jgi:CTP:molybdopterin cytidylyltransferase MocA
MKPQKVTAVILAAGLSLRMKDFKPLLLLGGITILERAVRLFHQNRIKDIQVVVGHRSEDLLPLLQSCGANWVVNESYREGMFSSVIAGISRLEAGRDAFFLLPVDIPLVRPQTIPDLLNSYPETGKHILYPTFQGRRGHPPLIDAAFAEEIRLWKGEGGLRSFLRQYDAQALEVEVADEFILSDVDTTADYRKLASRYANYDIPSPMECRVLLAKKFPLAGALREHCQKVAQAALRLAEELNRAGCRLNLDLIVAAGLLHDLAKGQPDHARIGEKILKELGFPAVAEIVGAHKDILPRREDQLIEEEVVYLADKMVRGNQLVPLQESCQKAKERFSSDPRASVMAAKRWTNAFWIKEKIEKKTGRELEFLFREPLPDGLSVETW